MTEKKPLLIITRPQKQSEQLLDALTKRLRRVPRSIINPLINIKDLKVDLPKSLMNPFIFTSQNAVSILAQRISQRGDVYCVGLKVADLAKANGFNVISISETVEKMINTGLPKKCSYFRGKQITVDIASQPSIKMDEYILYAQELLEINNDIEFQIDKGCIIPVYSENMANHLVNCLNSNNDHIILVCISNKVSKPFEKLGFKNIIVSPEPSSDAMIETLATKV
ncbi:uroporphyrinogen-III synthase [Amylibacter sp.]|nr:uroporphyrinogen-III synthase [Amylibacter sp.]MDB4248829.1 uroporphyrinogen-III synthase [Amylibacter sp.]